MPDAKVASEKALAMSPDEPDAICLKSLIANRPVAPKAVPGAKQMGPREMSCRDFSDAKDAPVVAKVAPPSPTMALVPRKR